MNKKFNIRLGLEEAELEVDKVNEENNDSKIEPESKKVLDDAVEAIEKPAEDLTESDMPEDNNSEDTPVEVVEETSEVDKQVEEKSIDETVVEETTTEDITETTEKDEAEVEIEEEKESTKEESSEEKEEKTEVEDPSSVSETADTIKENDDNSKQLDDASEVAATLESIAYEIQESLSVGGLTPSAANLTLIATESLYNKVGISITKNKSITVESFSSPSSRVRNTKVAIESIMDRVITIYESIIKSIARGIEWIKNFLKNFFNIFEKSKNEIKDLRTALAKTTKTSIDHSKVKFEKINIINSLKCGRMIDITNNISSLSSFSHMYFLYVERERKIVVKNIQTIIQNVSNGTHDMPKQIFLMPDFMGTGIVKKEILGHSPELDTLESYSLVTVLPGDSTFLAFLPSDVISEEKWNETVRKSKFSFVVDQDNVTDFTEIPILDKTEITKLLDKLDALAEEGIAAKKVFDDFCSDKTDLYKDLNVLIKKQKNVSKADQIDDKINEIKDPDFKKPTRMSAVAGITSRVQMLDNTFVTGSSKLSSLMMKTLSAGIGYGSDCVRAYV